MKGFSSVPASFFCRDTAEVARDLLGMWLVNFSVEGCAGGIIVETEAYRGAEDPASHAYRGETRRNRAMFGEPGKAYVYFIYGNHFCLNVVAHPPGKAGAVLLRALEPRIGVELMENRRGGKSGKELCNGPGKLCCALGVDRSYYGMPFRPLCERKGLGLGKSGHKYEYEIECGPRIGIKLAREARLRFWIKGNPYVSKLGRAFR